MAEKLLSLGLDVGTTTTQLILSELQVENQASGFVVPRMEITDRKIRYQSPVYFTPLLGKDRVDGEAIRQLLTGEYEKAGIRRADVDTGAVIITGETSRRENARAVVDALSEFAGDFVVATAGPHLESVLAAKGSGAVAYSEETGCRVLHMDIGGGTTNLALVDNGEVMSTGCLNVGGRLLKFDQQCRVTYLSPVLSGLCSLKVGDKITQLQVRQLCGQLVQVLEMAAGLCKPTNFLERLSTKEAGIPWTPPKEAGVISFSGGVAECIGREADWTCYGDLGPVLGQMIRQSLLCRGRFRLGEHAIRATVIGAGCHSARLSGSTVFCRNARFPLKNLPVVTLSQQEQDLSAEALSATVVQRLSRQDTDCVLALPGFRAPGYDRVLALAAGLAPALTNRPVLIALEQDMAKALGQALALRLPRDTSLVCIDGLQLQKGSYLDIGAPVGPALPVVIKTLVLQH